MHLHEALARAACPAAVNATAPIGQKPLSPAPRIGHPLSLLFVTAFVASGLRVLLLTRAWLYLDNATR
jgi:hypothetical protein